MESKKENPVRKKRSVLARAGKIFLWIIGCFLFLIILILILIQTAPVQNFARKKIVSYLENKLKTKVEIGKLDIKFPTAISLQNIFVEDQSKDTLLYGGELKVDISMFKLLKKTIEIQEISLNNIVLKVKRQPPDSVFNFQFIADAFAGNSSATSKSQDTSSAINMNISKILVHNTRIVYKDAYTGNDMDLAIGDLNTKISTFDPAHLLFDIPSITLNGLTGYFHQIEPLKQSVKKTVAEAAAQPDNYLQFLNKEMNFSNINVDFKSEPSNLNSSFIIGRLVLHPKTVDLKNSIITLKDASVDNSTIGIETNSYKIKQTSKDTVLTTAPPPPYKIISGELTINNSSLKYDDDALPHIPKGMDFSHMYLTDLSLKANNLEYSFDTTIVSIKSANFKEKSGFVLNDLTTDFEMNPTGVSLQNLDVVTPHSEVKRSAVISYPSLAAMQKNPGVLGLDIDLVDSKINVKDIQFFLPSFSTTSTPLNSNSVLYVNARITGKVNNLNFKRFVLKGLNATDIDASGTIKGLPDVKKLYADLNIHKFQTSKSDILSLVPAGTLPPGITLPQNISAYGTVKGNMNSLNTDVTVNSSLGNAHVNGTLVDITDKSKAHYDLVASAGNLQLGTIMQNPKLGLLNGQFKVKGVGYNPETANATFSGVISAITLNGYTYKNVKANGSIAHKIYKINADINDPNLVANLSANGEFAGKFPGLHINATIDSIKTLPLHLTPNSIIYHGDINGDFANTDPDNLDGNLLITHSILLTDSQRITLDSLQVTASNNGGLHSLALKTDFITATINGRYKLTQMADVFQQAIQPYYTITTTKNVAKVDPYDFTIKAGAINNGALKAFLPQLTALKPLGLSGHFASDSGWNMSMNAPYIVYGAYTINDVKLSAVTKSGGLGFNASVGHFQSGTSLNVYAATLSGTLNNNNIDFALNIKDQKSVDKYNLSGQLLQPTPGNYTFSLKPGTLLLNYDKWNVNPENSIQYFNKDIIATNFILSQSNQHLSLNSVGTGSNRPLQIDFKNFKISTLAGFVQSDSLLINGLLNGNAVVKNIRTQPTFTSDITVNDLSVYNDTLGTLTAKVNNNIADNYNTVITLNGFGNQVNISGNYIVKPTNSSFDFVTHVVSLQMKSIEPFTKGGIKDSRGYLYGKVAISGSLNNPNIDGKINFQDVAFNVTALDNVFKLDKEAIAIVNNKGFELNYFTIRDTANNALTIDGSINTPDFFNYSFDLGIKARNFQAINSTNKDNKLFYGKMVFSTNLTVKGTPTHPIVDGTLSIDDKTDFTAVMPQAAPGVEDRKGIVRFVDYSKTAEDSLLMMAPYDSLNVAPLAGYDISINITVNKAATFNLIVDQANGDFLKLKGSGQLTAGIDASGKITMVGSYEIDQGSYNLSFNFLKRNFSIQKGSRIVWTGEPTTAQINITAVYIANTAPIDLVQDQTSGDLTMYKQKLPFEVHLTLAGELLKPDISFDIVLPTDKNYTVSRDVITTSQNVLLQLRQDPGEMNKQVFALLLLGRFVGQNPFASSAGGMDAQTFAMQSVSRLLSEQLNALTENLIQGVDINFDLATTSDYTTGNQQNRTDLNVGISKRFLSDRLTVTVGSDFELQGPQTTGSQQQNFAGNISINYKLSKDGRYMLRAYRKNDYEDIVQGYVIETGIGFIISADFNKLNELFLSREKRRKKRQIRRDNKEISKQDAVKKENEQTITPPAKATENDQ